MSLILVKSIFILQEKGRVKGSNFSAVAVVLVLVYDKIDCGVWASLAGYRGWAFECLVFDPSQDFLFRFLCPRLQCLVNPFEFIWNLKSNLKFWKFCVNLKKISYLFISNNDSRSGAMYVYLTLSLDKLEYTWLHSAGSMFEINFQTDKKFSDLNQTFKFQNLIWDFKFKWIFKT